jgi:hypothetical protein
VLRESELHWPPSESPTLSTGIAALAQPGPVAATAQPATAHTIKRYPAMSSARSGAAGCGNASSKLLSPGFSARPSLVLVFLAVGGLRRFGRLRGRIHLVGSLEFLVQLVARGCCLAAVNSGLLLQS